jgi:pyruvate dehydrogenase E2 component (dihydrolipoamide acetyltransferase)
MSDDVVVMMPKLGETVTEGTVGSWLKRVGDQIAFDDPLFEVSTDKVDSEIPSPADGVVAEILVQAGETVPVGTPLVRISPVGTVVENRIPAASHAVAAAGGPALSDPASPAMGGSEAMPALEDPGVAVPTGEVHDIAMPKLGETVTEGTVGSWLKQVGDTVAFDDPLFEVSTDKVDSEIPSPYDGTLLEILVQSGETVPVGTPLARIGEAGAAGAGGGTLGGAYSAVSGFGPAAVGVPSAPGGASSGGTPAADASPRSVNGNDRMLSPLVRRSIAEAGLDPAQIIGSGVGGRIRREDVERAVAATAGRHTPSASAARGPSAVADTPAAQRLPAAATAAPSRQQPDAAVQAGERVVVEPLPRIRLTIAERMTQSVRTAPQVWTSVEVDFERVEAVRGKLKTRFREQEGVSLTPLPFVARAVCDALRAFPHVNSSIDIEAKTRTVHRYVNLGIAVDLNEQGLVVPVVRDADSMNLRGLARAIRAVADKATSRKTTADDLTGSTFTLTSPGPIADYASAPIINQPNSAILGLGIITRRPVAVGDAIAIHPTTILSFVYDHRSFDGATASRFMAHVRDTLQDRDWEVELA